MEELVDKIVEIEWSYFTNLKNTGGRASCQDNREEFFLTRKSQWESLNEDILKSYLDDLEEYKRNKRNPLFEKYAYMMQYTHKDEYEKIKEYLPKKNIENEEIIDKIEAIIMKWEVEFSEKYPKISHVARAIDTNDEGKLASIRTYLRGEHSTYSVKTNTLYYNYISSLKYNLVEEIYSKIICKKGFKSLDELENINN